MAKAVIKTVVDANTSPFERGLIRAGQSAERFKNTQIKQLGGAIAGVFAVRAVTGFIRDTLKAADSIDNMSRALGVGVEEYQALVKVAERAGASGALESGLVRLRKSMDDISDDKKIQAAFKTFGMSMDQVLASSPDKILQRIAIAMKESGNSAEVGAAAGDLLGRQYVRLNDVMNTLATDGLDNIKNGLLETNEIMSRESTAAADAMELAWTKAMDRMTGTLRKLVIDAIAGFRVMREFFYTPAAIVGAVSGGASWSEAAQIATKQMKDVLDDMYGIAGAGAKGGGGRGPRSRGGGLAVPGVSESGITVSAPQAADALARIGGIVGGQTSPELNMLQRIAKIQDAQEKLQERIAKAAEKTSQVLEED